jgi:hypothetical protein
MSNFRKVNVEGGELPNQGNMPNPQKPSDAPVVKADDKEEDKKYKQRLNKEFHEFHKANIEFNSIGEKMDRDTIASVKDMVHDYSKYLPDTDRKRLDTIILEKSPGFKLDKEDSVHQF